VVAGGEVLLSGGALHAVVVAGGVDLGTAGRETKVTRDLGDVVETNGTDTGLVAIHVVVGVRASETLHGSSLLGVGDDVLSIIKTLGVEIDVLHVFRTQSILYIDTVKGTVTSRGFSIIRVHAHGTIGVIKSCPHRADHKIGVLEPI
jgi:hypothetical protein